MPLTFVPPSTTTFSAPSPTTPSTLDKKSDNPPITLDNSKPQQSIEESTSTSVKTPTVSSETTNDDDEKDDIEIHESVESEVHGDENEQDTAGTEEEDSDESVKVQDDEEEDDEDEDGNGDEDRSGDKDNDGKGGNLDPGGSGMAHAGQGSPFSGVYIASTTIGVVCLFGICGFFVYLCRKRRRERIQTAWVESVFSSGGQNRSRATRPYSYRNSGTGSQHYTDMESVSDVRSEMTMDRRHSTTMGSVIGENSFSNTIRTSVMAPALVRNMNGMVGYNRHLGPASYHHQVPNRMPSSNDQLLQANQYEAYYGQDQCEDHAEIAISDIYSSAEAYRNQYRHYPHSLCIVEVPDHRDHGNSLQDAAAYPLPRRPAYPTNHRHSLDSTAHSYTLAASGMSCGTRSHQRTGMSEYRRPHSLALDSTGENLAIMNGSQRYNAHHILEEDEDGEVAFRINFKRNGKEKTNGNVLNGGLRQQLKRLSVPYVQAIRQQQRTCASASCMETGHDGSGNGHNHSVPVPELVTTMGRRWSRALSRGNAGNSKGGEFDEQSRSSSGNGEDAEAEAFETDDRVNAPGGQGRRMEGHSSRRHRWVHPGSLDSFQGLDGSSPQRLRVMNPDVGGLSLLLIQPCYAAAAGRNIDLNQRVDAPSPNDFTPLTGPEFAYTKQTPLGLLEDARKYADGALATQKLIAAPLIPIDRQLWIGVDTRTAYFGNNFGGEKINNVSQLLQAGMRRLVLDLWWDGASVGWQLCPRQKKDGGQLSMIRKALEQGQQALEASLPLQRMGNPQTVPQDHVDSGLDSLLASQPLSSQSSSLSASTPVHSSTFPHSTVLSKRTFLEHASPEYKGFFHDTNDKPGAHQTDMKKRAQEPKERAGQEKEHSRKKLSSNHRVKHPSHSRQANHGWFSKKKQHSRPATRPKKSVSLDQDQRHKTAANKSTVSTSPTKISVATGNRAHQPHEGVHRLAMGKGMVSNYDKSAALDRTIDGIACSTGEDLVMLLQELQDWIEETSKDELEDALLIILNLNELSDSDVTPGPPTPTTPASSPLPSPSSTPTNITTAAWGQAPPQLLSDEDFFRRLASPNTNKTLKALVPNIVSLKDLFLDAFPSLIYSPTQLDMDRADLKGSWWKNGPVGLDYYNTTTDPSTGRIRAPTGWPTSSYLTEVIQRRIVIGIGANNLQTNTSYNITDDFTTFHRPSMLGQSMTDSGLLRISSSLDQATCNFPVPSVMMMPTGSELNLSDIMPLKNSSNDVMTEVTWSFSSMSDSDVQPWSFSSGQLATTCGFSALIEGPVSALTFSEQTAMSIWSWDLDQPPLNQIRSRDRRCGAMQSNGRWVVQDCNMKLPIACRQIGTSVKWIIYEEGAANYRDVKCPDGYTFDVPRTARENQALHSTLQEHWNVTSPDYQSPLMAQQNYKRSAKLQDVNSPLTSSDELLMETVHHKRYFSGKNDDSDQEDGRSKEPGEPRIKGRRGLTTKDVTRAELPPVSGALDGGMIWIDISSWQTAGCWVPGGVHGSCPYQDPDNTVALQEIIKVSSIGGVIILILAGIFLYLKCRRNVRHRKASKRRADVRTKIMRTEVETVPA
ncbi:hypothetical protein BG011_006896 [Mortierella polycephala]|uniref:Maintenance of telomere capping protein 6 n=1 Tax=Mortierella polycephala TaxID=41804 RepID=A0A9P6U8S9_9FUNG|nr:hypothetical protein BG011_006896 [Mortierella polycephala]